MDHSVGVVEETGGQHGENIVGGRTQYMSGYGTKYAGNSEANKKCRNPKSYL